MVRPRKRRWINSRPGADYFKPRGVPINQLEVIALTMDEYEAMRLYDAEELDQTAAAERMKISRATFGRIISSAHKKVAEALLYGKAIQISGGIYHCPPAGGLGHRGYGSRGRGGGWGRARRECRNQNEEARKEDQI